MQRSRKVGVNPRIRDLAGPSGFIGLQVHGIKGEGSFKMKFRPIRIRPLAGEQSD